MNKSVVYATFVFFLCTFLYANPFITPSSQQNNKEDSEEDSQTKITHDLSVRVSSVSDKNLDNQRSLRETLGKAFYTWEKLKKSNQREDSRKAAAVLFAILSISFVFGIIHALGPGHRKTIVFSLYLSRKAPIWEPLVVGLALSALHAGSAIVIVLILQGISGSIFARADVIARWMEGISYLIVIVTALILLVYTIIEYILNIKKNRNGENENRKQLSLAAFVFSGIYPCPGAVLVLVLSFTLAMIPLGMLSVLIMSLGMSLPVIASAYIAWAGRAGLFHFFKKKERSLGIISFIAEFSGYLLLLVFSLYIAWPFLKGLLAWGL